MKIGIITFHRAVNYGAILQAYALQRSIEKYGVKAYIIDYESNVIKEQYRLFNVRNWMNIKYLISDLLLAPLKVMKKIKFNMFISEKINLLAFNESSLNEVDKFITGSDQVWNYKLTGLDGNYFLNFAKNKSKNSYAASFGITEIPSNYIDVYKTYLSGFDRISVREETGGKLIKDIVKRDADISLDPTLLLNIDDWKPRKYSGKKYIFIFELAYSPKLRSIAKKIAQKYNYNIYCISDKILSGDKFIYRRTAGPSQWVDLMFNAEIVLTNSFHGTAFAINFNKEFYTEVPKANKATSSRVESLLKKVNLESRIINDEIELMGKIDWKSVNIKLDAERDKSNQYLKSILFD